MKDPNVTITGNESMLDMDVSNTTSGGEVFVTPTKGQERQPTPKNATPQTTDNESPDDQTPGPSNMDDNNNQGTATNMVGPRSDLDKVQKVLSSYGGLTSQNRPAPENLKPGKGQDLKIGVDKFLASDFDYEGDAPPVRPDPSSLRRLTADELLPPPSNLPIPLEPNQDLPEFVQEQRIEFLVVIRPTNDANADWGFPTAETLQKMYDKIRLDLEDNLQIFDVALWHRVDKNGIATIMLSTVNLGLMNQIRQEIRLYTGYPGFNFETYNKLRFLKRYGISLYVPRENAGYKFRTIGRTLFYKYPDLRSAIEIISEATFTDNHPDWTPDRRSRIGDKIYLLDSPELAKKLQKYPEDFRFHLSEGFSVTLRGGLRGDEVTSSFTNSFASKVLMNSTADAMKNARQSSTGRP